MLLYGNIFFNFKDETDVELSSLLISECQSVFNQLILYLSVNRDQVFQGFSILACNDPKYEGPKEFKTEADVVWAKQVFSFVNYFFFYPLLDEQSQLTFT